MISFIIFFGGAMLCFFAMCLLGLAVMLAHVLLARGLAQIDPERWKLLEFSAYFDKRSQIRMAAISELIRSGEYKQYGNRRVSFLAKFIWVGSPVYLGLFFAIPLLLLGLALT